MYSQIADVYNCTINVCNKVMEFGSHVICIMHENHDDEHKQ